MKENKYLEFKSQVTNTFLKTVSAFANFGKGEIEFGVADDDTIIGIKNPDQICLDIENRINDSISPKPDYAFEINRRTNVITLIVNEGLHKPYLYKGKAYKRNDTSTIEVDRVELNRLTLSGSNLYYEQLKSDEQDLKFDILQEKLRIGLGVEQITSDILKTLNLYNDLTGFNKAAALLADDNNFSGIDAARFGDSIDVILDRETFDHMSVLKQIDSAIDLYKKYYQYELIDGVERKSKEIIPEKAFREVVANAVIHRTWDVNASIRIAMHPDRIEIMSPGGLPYGLTEVEFLQGQISMLRNPVLGNVFFRLHYIEMFGTGVKRIKEAYQAYSLKPIFEVFENSIKVTLPTITAKPSFTVGEETVYAILLSGKYLSSSEIASGLGLSKDKTIRLLNSLAKKNLIKVLGNGRGTKYAIY